MVTSCQLIVANNLSSPWAQMLACFPSVCPSPHATERKSEAVREGPMNEGIQESRWHSPWGCS